MMIFKNCLSVLILGVATACSLGAQSATAQKILIVGDSLSAEYGLPRGTGWVVLLEKKLAVDPLTSQRTITVVNASISGETTSGGLSRLPALLLQHKPTIVVLELGGNDALRGMAMKQTEKNFSTMTSQSKTAGAKVLLLGMQVPPNFGVAYNKEFAGVYERVAKEHKISFVPFFLKGVADSPNAIELFQSDGIHPTTVAQATMLANVWPAIATLLK